MTAIIAVVFVLHKPNSLYKFVMAVIIAVIKEIFKHGVLSGKKGSTGRTYTGGYGSDQEVA